MGPLWHRLAWAVLGLAECSDGDPNCRVATVLRDVLSRLLGAEPGRDGDRVRCPVCGGVFSRRGIASHLRRTRCGEALSRALAVAYALYRVADTYYVRTCRDGTLKCCALCRRAFLRRSEAAKHVVLEHLDTLLGERGELVARLAGVGWDRAGGQG